MTALSAERTARVSHRCWRCGGHIKPGERYTSVAITPGGDLGYERWTRLAEHLSYTACDNELAADPSPDAPDGDLSAWPVPLDANGRYAGEAKEAIQ